MSYLTARLKESSSHPQFLSSYIRQRYPSQVSVLPISGFSRSMSETRLLVIQYPSNSILTASPLHFPKSFIRLPPGLQKAHEQYTRHCACQKAEGAYHQVTHSKSSFQVKESAHRKVSAFSLLCTYIKITIQNIYFSQTHMPPANVLSG